MPLPLRVCTIAVLLMLSCSPLSQNLHAGNFNSGVVSCPTSGAKQITTTQTFATWANLGAAKANTGVIYIGNSSITTASVAGTFLNASDTFNLPPHAQSAVYNLSQIWFACTVNTDIIGYTYLQ